MISIKWKVYETTTQNNYKKYKKSMNSKLPKPAQISDYVSNEIKPCGLGFRIPDMEAEWRLKVITALIS